MHGPTCIVWANLTPFSLKGKYAIMSAKSLGRWPDPAFHDAQAQVRRLWGLFCVCCLDSVDLMQNCEGSLSRDKFLF